MVIKFISRKEITDRYLEQINKGTPLTREQKLLLKGLNN